MISISGTATGRYRLSKTAMNMAGRLLAKHLESANIAVGMIHPGAVNTGMTREAVGEETAKKFRSPKSAARALLKVVPLISLSNTGAFWCAPAGDEELEQAQKPSNIPW